MTGLISVNLKKIKASTRVNALLDENYRDEDTAERYDDGHRMIDTGKTAGNVFLLERPENYDAFRRDRINRINEARAERGSMPKPSGERQRLKEAKTLRKEASKRASATRKLRADTVDTIGLIVQPSADFINALNRDEQVRFFRDSLEVMQGHPEEFGKVETAVIHFDENTPHMQCLASTMNEQTLTSDTQRIMGNKTKMSKRQTLLAEEMKARGWDVERGLKRIDNPAYKNWKDELEAKGVKVNRYNDRKLMQIVEQKFKAEREGIETDRLKNEIVSDSLESKERQLDFREESVNKREKELDEKESSISEREQSQKRRELSSKKQLSDAQADYNARVNALNKRIKDFNKKKQELDERDEESLKVAQNALELQEKNEARATELDQLKATLDIREKALKDKEESAKEREKSLDAREKSLGTAERRTLEHLKDMKAEVAGLMDVELERRSRSLKETEELKTMDDFTKAVDSIYENRAGRAL